MKNQIKPNQTKPNQKPQLFLLSRDVLVFVGFICFFYFHSVARRYSKIHLITRFFVTQH